MNRKTIYFTAGADHIWPGTTYEKVTVEVTEEGVPAHAGESLKPWEGAFMGAPLGNDGTGTDTAAKADFDDFQRESAKRGGLPGRFIPSSETPAVASTKSRKS